MPSPALLDFVALLQPIAGENPAGAPVSLPVRQKLDRDRKETEPHPDDPSQGEIPKKADWKGIASTCEEMLASKSKDLLLAARLTEALTKSHGFAGLRDGLHLLEEMISQCWDRMYPIPDEGDGMDIRAGPFNWLSDADRGARFPGTVRATPLVRVGDLKEGGHSYSWRDWERVQKKQEPITEEEFAKAVPIDPTVAEDLAQATEELGRLDQALISRLGPDAPGMIGLRQALEDCQKLMENVQRRQPPPPPPKPDPPKPNGEQPPQPDLRKGNLASREQAYEQLAVIANTLERLEPHSPIPDLLRRAIQLGKMSFRDLVRELVRDQAQLTELRREFGIKEPPAS